MDKETILTGELSEDDIKQEEAVRKDWERFSILLDLCYEHYISVDTKPDLANLCSMLVAIGEDFGGDELHHIPSKGRNRLIGEIITKAVKFDDVRLSAPGKKAPVSNKAVFKSAVKTLVEAAHKENHKKNKEAQTQVTPAFEFVADLLYKYGVTDNGRKYSTSAISRWYYDCPKSTR